MSAIDASADELEREQPRCVFCGSPFVLGYRLPWALEPRSGHIEGVDDVWIIGEVLVCACWEWRCGDCARPESSSPQQPLF